MVEWKDTRDDSFCEMANICLEADGLKRLAKCSQLGAKSSFLREGSNVRDHTRFSYSAGAGLTAMIWYEALMDSARGSGSWAWSQEARLAPELAVLLHEARHLPFSHMTEEILEGLHWGAVVSLTTRGIEQRTERIGRPLDSHFRDQLRDVVERRCGKKGVALPEWWPYVESLQDGESGIPWLDATVDSAPGADKIDYVFRDSGFTGKPVRLSAPEVWLGDFLGDQKLTSGGLVCLEGESALAALALL